MLKLKLQYFGHLMRSIDSLEKTLMLGGIGGRRKRGQQRWDGWMASLTRWTWVWVNSGSWWWTGRPGVLWFMGSQRVRHDWVTELNCTEFCMYVWWWMSSKLTVVSSLYVSNSNLYAIHLKLIQCHMSIVSQKKYFEHDLLLKNENETIKNMPLF